MKKMHIVGTEFGKILNWKQMNKNNSHRKKLFKANVKLANFFSAEIGKCLSDKAHLIDYVKRLLCGYVSFEVIRDFYWNHMYDRPKSLRL